MDNLEFKTFRSLPVLSKLHFIKMRILEPTFIHLKLFRMSRAMKIARKTLFSQNEIFRTDSYFLFTIMLVEEDEIGNESIAINRTLLNQAYEIIEQKGENGVTVLELKKLMNVDFYMSRMLVRFLEKRKFISSRKVDDFRQHKMRLVSH